MAKIDRELAAIGESVRRKGERRHGLLGDFDGTVEAPYGVPGYYYVRVEKGSQYEVGIFRSGCGVLASIVNHPVVLEQDPLTWEWIIAGEDYERLAQLDLDFTPALRIAAHRWSHHEGGSDELYWLGLRQLYQLRVQPSDSGDTYVDVLSGVYMAGDQFIVVQNQSLNLEDYYPTGGLSSKWVVVYLDTSGTAQATTGAALIQNLTPPAEKNYAIALVNLRIVGGSKAAITREDIVTDLRFTGTHGANTFLDLLDTPARYQGYAGYGAVVNNDGDALTFSPVMLSNRMAGAEVIENGSFLIHVVTPEPEAGSDILVATHDVTFTTAEDDTAYHVVYAVEDGPVWATTTNKTTDGFTVQVWATSDVVAGSPARTWQATIFWAAMRYSSAVGSVDADLGGAKTFDALTDTPASKSGYAGKYVKVNAAEDALEYDDILNETDMATLISEHADDDDAHHTRYADAEAVAAILAADGPGSGLDADTLDGDELSDIQDEIDSDIATHAADDDAHHAPVTLVASADVLLGLSSQSLSLDDQAANVVLAGPSSGGNAAPTFRSLVLADIPASADVSAGTEALLKSNAAGQLTVADLFTNDGGTFGISGNELLTVNAAGTFAFSGISGVTVDDGDWIGNSGSTARLGFDSSGGTDYAYFSGCNVGIGTASPSGELEIYNAGFIQSIINRDNDLNSAGMGELVFQAKGTNLASIRGISEGTGEDSGALAFLTKASAGTYDNKMYIDPDGNVGIGTTSPDYILDVDGVIGVSDNAGDPSTVANKATFYGKDVGGTVEAFAQDDAGNAAQLTAHPDDDDMPFTPEPWEHIASYSNAYLGVRRYFRIEKALRDMETLTGERYIYDVEIERRDWYMDQARQGTRKPMPGWMRNFIDRGAN